MAAADNKMLAIIGGGPGGLTLARLLQLRGVNVKVYERDTDKYARVQGATLDLHPDSGLKAVEAAGLLQAFNKAYRPGADKGRVLSKAGDILYDEHPYGGAAEEHEGIRPEIDRSVLRNLLLDSLLPDTVRWNSQITELEQQGNGWLIKIANGSDVYADIVIGADGANSNIRRYVTDEQPVYAGTVILQGNIPADKAANTAINNILLGGKIYAFGDGNYVHVSSKGDGSIDFYFSFLQAAGKLAEVSAINNREACLRWYDERMYGWHPMWRELPDMADMPILVRPQYILPLAEKWKRAGSITLLGDAAHIMPPSGAGVNMAMLDALQLANALCDDEYASVKHTIAEYESIMIARAKAEGTDAMDMADWMHRDGAAEKLVNMFRGID